MILPLFRNMRVAMSVITLGMCLGTGCPRPDDTFEPNDTIATATPLEPGVPITASVAQRNIDVFGVEAMAGQTVLFRIEDLDFEVCPIFSAANSDGTILYEEPVMLCRGFASIDPTIQVEGSSLTIIQNEAFELRIPAATDGRYFISIYEGGMADNIFTFNWSYRLTATFE